jgi:hypothetical protein
VQFLRKCRELNVVLYACNSSYLGDRGGQPQQLVRFYLKRKVIIQKGWEHDSNGRALAYPA